MDGNKILDSIAKNVMIRFDSEVDDVAEKIADDILHAKDGFMSEEEIGAMVVDLLDHIAVYSRT